MSVTKKEEKDRLVCECGNEHFIIGTRGMVGNEDEYIDTIICVDCGGEFKESPAPSKIKELEEGDE